MAFDCDGHAVPKVILPAIVARPRRATIARPSDARSSAHAIAIAVSPVHQGRLDPDAFDRSNTRRSMRLTAPVLGAVSTDRLPQILTITHAAEPRT